MEVINYPLSGDLFAFQNHFFEVIGNEHPHNFIICCPIDEFNTNIENFSGYQLEQNHYLNPYYKIPRKKVLNYQIPSYNILRENETSSEFTFYHFLHKYANIPKENLGVISKPLKLKSVMNDSLKYKLYFKHHLEPGNDVIIYGIEHAQKARILIRKCIEQKINIPGIQIRPFSFKELKNQFKNLPKTKNLSFYDFIKFESRKIFKGIFNDLNYQVRCLEYSSRDDFQKSYNNNKYRNIFLGEIKIHAQVRDNFNWWTTPACLGINVSKILDYSLLKHNYLEILNKYRVSLKQIASTFTLDQKYIENARLLEHIEVFGKLQLIIPENFDQNTYLRIDIGPKLDHYIKFQ